MNLDLRMYNHELAFTAPNFNKLNDELSQLSVSEFPAKIIF